MSGRACAAVDTNIPALKVAASATAILNDINLSTFGSVTPAGPSNSMQIPAKRGFAAGFAHALLTACVNQEVSARAEPGVQQG
jgi:hypothetical protein